MPWTEPGAVQSGQLEFGERRKSDILFSEDVNADVENSLRIGCVELPLRQHCQQQTIHSSNEKTTSGESSIAARVSDGTTSRNFLLYSACVSGS